MRIFMEMYLLDPPKIFHKTGIDLQRRQKATGFLNPLGFLKETPAGDPTKVAGLCRKTETIGNHFYSEYVALLHQNFNDITWHCLRCFFWASKSGAKNPENGALVLLLTAEPSPLQTYKHGLYYPVN